MTPAPGQQHGHGVPASCPCLAWAPSPFLLVFSAREEQRPGGRAPAKQAPETAARGTGNFSCHQKCSRLGFGPLSSPTLSVHSVDILSSASFWVPFGGLSDQPSPFVLVAPVLALKILSPVKPLSPGQAEMVVDHLLPSPAVTPL